jgi:hypothetical protein
MRPSLTSTVGFPFIQCEKRSDRQEMNEKK